MKEIELDMDSEVIIGETRISISRIQGNKVKLSIFAPRSISVVRAELLSDDELPKHHDIESVEEKAEPEES